MGDAGDFAVESRTKKRVNYNVRIVKIRNRTIFADGMQDAHLFHEFGVGTAIVTVLFRFYEETIHGIAMRMQHTSYCKAIAAIVATATKNLETSRRIRKSLHYTCGKILRGAFHELIRRYVLPIHNGTVEFVHLF